MKSIQNQILTSSAGPIEEVHLAILLELIQFHPNDSQLYGWLGYRYAEKSDLKNALKCFSVSYSFYYYVYLILILITFLFFFI